MTRGRTLSPLFPSLQHKMRARPQIHSLPFLVFIFFLILNVGCRPTANLTTETTLHPHKVPSNPSFTELWTTDSFIQCASCLIAEDGKVYLLGSLSQDRTPHLIRLDLFTGDVDWEVRLNQDAHGPMLLTTNFIYVGVAGTSNIGSETQTFGSAQIMALDRNSGDEVWETRIPGANAIGWLAAANQTLFASGNIYFSVTTFHAETGQILESSQNELVLFDDGAVRYAAEPNGTLTAWDSQQNNVLWQRDEPITGFHFDAAHNLVLIKTGDNVSGKVVAVDSHTGQLLWQKNRVLSMASDGSFVYLLTLLDSPLGWGGDNVIDAQLLALDIQSGALLGEFTFDPPGIQSGYGNYGYSVAAAQNIVLVYLGDGRQLFALQFDPPE